MVNKGKGDQGKNAKTTPIRFVALTELNLKMLGELEEGKREFSLENLERLLELNQNVYE